MSMWKRASRGVRTRAMLLPFRFLARCKPQLLLRRANSTATPTTNVVDVATKYKVPEGYLLAYEGAYLLYCTDTY